MVRFYITLPFPLKFITILQQSLSFNYFVFSFLNRFTVALLFELYCEFFQNEKLHIWTMM